MEDIKNDTMQEEETCKMSFTLTNDLMHKIQSSSWILKKL